MLTFAVLRWGLFTALTALVPPGLSGSIIILVLVRFALGAGEATIYPATSQFVERWFPMRERGKANGIIFGGVGVGSGLTPPIVTALSCITAGVRLSGSARRLECLQGSFGISWREMPLRSIA